MTRAVVLLAVLVAPHLVLAYPTHPDLRQTIGTVCSEPDPDFAYLRYQEKIPYCFRNVDFSERQRIYDHYRIPEKCRHRYTIDHFIPLSLGGNNSPENLWPEHKLVKATRPHLEEELYWAMENGNMTQKEAIAVIVQAKMNPSLPKNDQTTDCDQ